jgi:glycosyltransferase involved in cell wall biosynthesis
MPHDPIRVAIFLDRFEPGGTQRQMIELIRRLDRERFDVHVACSHRTGTWVPLVRSDHPIAEFPIFGFRRPSTLTALVRFARWCRKHRIDILQSCEFYGNVFALTGAVLAGVPLRIGGRRGMYVDKSHGQKQLHAFGYRGAHAVVANSRAAADLLIAEGVSRSKVIVIPNGLDVQAFAPRVARAHLRRIVIVADLRDRKGHDVLIDAMPTVIAGRPDAELLIVGDGPLRGALEQRAQQRDITASARFLGHRDDVPAILADADVFALPSYSEAFPNAVLEAMAAGLPLIVTGVGGIPELVEHAHSGLLVPPGSPDALAAALLQLLNDPAEAAALGAAARRAVESRFSFDRMVEEFEALYLRLLDARTYAGKYPSARRERGQAA